MKNNPVESKEILKKSSLYQTKNQIVKSAEDMGKIPQTILIK